MDNWFNDFSIDFGDNNEEPKLADGRNDANDSPAEESAETHADEAQPHGQDSDSSEPMVADPVSSVDSDLAAGSDLTDEDFERIFGEIVSKAKQDEEVLANARIVIEAEAHVAETEKKEAEALEKFQEVDHEVAEMERKLIALKREREEARNSLWDVRSSIREGRRNVEEKKAAAKQSYRNYMQAFEMELLSNELEERAKKQAWFTGIDANGETLKALPHQWDAMRFMAAGKRVILGDSMGLGKTLSALGTLDLVDSKRVLIIAPTDISGNFKEESDFWTQRGSINIKGETKASRKAMLTAMDMFESFTIVMNYEAWRKDHSLIEQLQRMHFDTVIADESHTIKETDTNAYRGLKEILHSNNWCPNCNKGTIPGVPCNECGWNGESHTWKAETWDEAYWETKSVKYIFLMTGTAILNKPDDLYSQLSLIDPVNFYNKQQYLRTYAEWDLEKQMWTFQYGGVDRLIRRLSGKFLSRTLEDAGIILPPQKPIIHSLELDPDRYSDQIEVINQIRDFAEIVLDEERRMDITAIITLILRQRQANVWAGGIELKDPLTGEVVWAAKEVVQSSIKMDKAVELCKEFTANGERIVIFSQFSSALRELHTRLNGVKNDNGDAMFSIVFDGQTPSDERAEIRQNFDRKNGEAKKWDIVLANYKTGGTGLNLTAATHTIILDREWNPGKENQALARTHRIGQTETTFVHILEIPDTIDEWMNEIINKKAEMIGGFNEGADVLRDELLKKLKSRKKK